jgi:hypothetical protein|nr:MAG TPA: hypothetical protein [Caudoviricetes sp.]
MNEDYKQQTSSRVIHDDTYREFLRKAKEIKESNKITEIDKAKLLEEINSLFEDFINKYYPVLNGDIDLRNI